MKKEFKNWTTLELQKMVISLEKTTDGDYDKEGVSRMKIEIRERKLKELGI